MDKLTHIGNTPLPSYQTWNAVPYALDLALDITAFTDHRAATAVRRVSLFFLILLSESSHSTVIPGELLHAFSTNLSWANIQLQSSLTQLRSHTPREQLR